MRALCIGGPIDGELREVDTTHFIVREWPKLPPIEAGPPRAMQECAAVVDTIYSIRRFHVGGDTRFLAAPRDVSDVQVFDALLRGYRP